MLGDARTEHMTRWVRHFRDRGDTVWLASAQRAMTADIELNLPLHRDFIGYPLLVPGLRKLIARLSPDLVVAHYLPNYGLLAALCGFRPHVIVGWGSDLLVLPQRGPLQRARLRLVAGVNFGQGAGRQEDLVDFFAITGDRSFVYLAWERAF